MKRDSLDEALRRKLHDAEAGLPVPPWAEMQRRMQLHANAHPAERVPLFRSWSRYAAAAVVLLGIGLGVWRVQRTHSWGEKSMAETSPVEHRIIDRQRDAQIVQPLAITVIESALDLGL